VALLRRRKPSADAAETSPEAGRPTGKGRPTPKRQRATPPLPPPTSRKEAYARLRQKSREQQSQARVGIKQGDDRYVLPRDRGPERRLVRDIVDARRNAGSYAFGIAILIVVATSLPGMPPVVRLAASYVWLAIILVLSLDSFLLSRIIRRAMEERFPDDQRRGHAFYGIMRAATFRRLRNPRPQVKLGETV
jgi:hypothetical protein